MLYNAYELQRSFLASASAVATASVELLQNPSNPFAYFGGGPMLSSALDVFAHASAPRGKPAFDLFLSQLQLLASEFGGVLGMGYANSSDTERETSGSLEPAVNKLKPHLPDGFVSKVWADKARGRRRMPTSKKSGL